MSSVVIQVESLSKQYRLGEVSTGSLGHDLNRWWHRVRGKEDPYLKVTQTNVREKAEKLKNENTEIKSGRDNRDRGAISAFQRFSVSAFSSDYVWALRDINFEVKRGEVLGIIGRNGAGKSTLLKILSRVTAPTTGEIRVKGRIASLLEVGTGFHPQLTGRENIYLNGAILGMTKAEIASKLDEIVDFSGCARYIDTPVKRYSSGMMVRLGFAVAAHLEPEILIVDEVLAVGDAEFQKKCVGKMQDVASHGRTVLFVSHNMASISALCSKVMTLENGTVALTGETEAVVDEYVKAFSPVAGTAVGERTDREGSGEVRCTDVWFEDDTGEKISTIRTGEPLTVCLRYQFRDTVVPCIFNFGIHNARAIALAHISSGRDPSFSLSSQRTGVIKCRIPAVPFNQGDYRVNTSFMDANARYRYDRVEGAAVFHVQGGDYYGSGKLPDSLASPLLLKCDWNNI